MHSYFVVLKAMFRNKFRIGAGKSKRSVAAFCILLGIAYALVMAVLLSAIILLKDLLALPGTAPVFYFFILMTVAMIVLIFGIIHLVTVLYLSKDTDFYSMLPVGSSVVFAAKLSYVYICETVLVAVVALPLLIAFGIAIKAWAWFYVLTVLTVAVVPALPLVIAALFAIPVMFIAGKLKNRSVVALIFYILLFCGFFSVYLYFLSAGGGVSEEEIGGMLSRLDVVLNILYPYTVLSFAACGIPMYGLNIGPSVVTGTVIFLGISAAAVVLLLIAAKFMYAQSARANNQTNNTQTKKGAFKTSGGTRALMKREYLSSLRTTQTAFQCYVVMFLPIIMAVIFGIMFGNLRKDLINAGVYMDPRFTMMLTYTTLSAMFATLGNAAATTFSREGNAMASLKILPVGIKKILMSKILAWSVLAVPVSLISVIIVGIFDFDAEYFILSIFSLIPLTMAFVVFGALWDLSAPKLKWTDPIQAVKHNGHVTIGQLICLAGGLAVMTVCIVLNIKSINFDVISAVCWSLIYAELVIFAVTDILLYRKAETYYNRIEI